MYHQSNARDLNEHLCKLIFESSGAPVTLVDQWGQNYKTANEYMSKKGLDVLRRSLRAFIDGKVLHHKFVRASNKTGLLIADAQLLSTLRLIANTTNDMACHRQIQRAIKTQVPNANTIAQLKPRKARDIVPETITSAPPTQIHCTKTPEAAEEICMDMLVDTNEQPQIENNNDKTEASSGSTPKRKRARRK